MITVEGIVIVAGWLTSLIVAVYAVPRIAARRVCEQFGLSQITQGGKTFFVPTDPSGDPVKVPIGVKQLDNGEQEVVMGYAPLSYSLPYLAADMAAMKVKMSINSARGKISKQLSGAALQSGMVDEMLPFLPKKVQAAVAIAKALGLGGGNNGGPGTQTPARTGGSSFKPGI